VLAGREDKQMKLSPPQQRIVDALRDGWDLYTKPGRKRLSTVAFLYNVGASEWIRVSRATVNFLESNAIIIPHNGRYLLHGAWRRKT
jgi:hypothetical protein